MRYFYRYNYFPDVRVPETVEKLYDIVSDPNNIEASLRYMRNGYNLTMAEISEIRFPKPPKEFNYAGRDIRTLSYKPIFKEVDAEWYDNVLIPMEDEILKSEMVIRAEIEAWHTPIQTVFTDDYDDIKRMLATRFKLKLEEVELIKLEE
jgi:hypothetical protein